MRVGDSHLETNFHLCPMGCSKGQIVLGYNENISGDKLPAMSHNDEVFFTCEPCPVCAVLFEVCAEGVDCDVFVLLVLFIMSGVARFRLLDQTLELGVFESQTLTGCVPMPFSTNLAHLFHQH